MYIRVNYASKSRLRKINYCITLNTQILDCTACLTHSLTGKTVAENITVTVLDHKLVINVVQLYAASTPKGSRPRALEDIDIDIWINKYIDR